MNGHHLILGELADFVTGETLKDTHDERYRQSIARILVEQKGYAKNDIRPRWDLRAAAGEKCATIKIDFSPYYRLDTKSFCFLIKSDGSSQPVVVCQCQAGHPH